MAKEYKYKGKSLEELKAMKLDTLAQLLTARARRTLKRGLTEQQKIFLNEVKKFNEGKRKKTVKTHCRDMIVLPEMVGAMIEIYDGKNFNKIQVKPEMIGHYLGEFAMTRREVKHSAPGVGATKSSAHVSVK